MEGGPLRWPRLSLITQRRSQVEEPLPMNRPLLIALLLIIALMIASWTLGELLRQRSGTRRRGRRR